MATPHTGDIRVGVIGAGIMGADHARQLRAWVPGAVPAMIADIDAVRAATVADELGARSTDDAEALIADPGVDAILIASHDSTHADLCRAAVRANKPVLCEKPLAPSLAESAELLRDVGDGAGLISLGFMRRFDPGYVELKRTVHSGEVGLPLVLHCVSRGVTSGPGATSESSVTGSSIHDLDIVPWLLDSPVVEAAWLAGRQSRENTTLQDPQVILLRTADGVLTTVETYLNARYGYDVRCEAVCETGTVSVAEPSPVVTDRSLSRGIVYAADWRPRFAEAYRRELTAWIGAVATGAQNTALATARDGLVASAVAEAVITSMHSGGAFVPVSVPTITES
ncbi:inositol 2-dehydrogenase [Nakamurella sp. YIM 132087]|uniref:Inositol 2-dehydrogenase n=1 Tax=Nakamurella alba TaxID=2665158 RepID=A0A7K1FTU0_9ACTN|nr:Gfo/Idh/MocA family oxidoreductase [Nakamurella alba]MTD16224.1 inositol 2-dehydrogenase [Nakamurella alba]